MIQQQKKDYFNRVKGCLVGQAIGDALGGRYEFMSPESAIKQVECDMQLQDFLPILGEGPHQLLPGQITDDTELALALTRSLVAERKYNRESIAQNYIEWLNSEPFDIGHTTKNALSQATCCQDMISNSEKYNRESLSNGCLMRISPLAIYGLKYDEKILKTVTIDNCKMTHCHPLAIEATVMFVMAIRTALLGGSKQDIYQTALIHCKSTYLQKLLEIAQHCPRPTPLFGTNKVCEPHQHMGFLGIAIQQTFYELLHNHNFYYSMINIVTRGGDTDTNACIAGSLLGAFYGIKNIPHQWRETILNYNNNTTRLSQYPKAATNDLLELAKALVK